jgi:hypothetical protein
MHVDVRDLGRELASENAGLTEPPHAIGRRVAAQIAPELAQEAASARLPKAERHAFQNPQRLPIEIFGQVLERRRDTFVHRVDGSLRRMARSDQISIATPRCSSPKISCAMNVSDRRG